MTQILSFIIGFGPLVLAALAAAVFVALVQPSVWRSPHQWLVWLIFILTFAPIGANDAAEGSLFRQLSWGGLFLFAATSILLSKNIRSIGYSKLLPIPLVLLLLWIGLSLFWSPATSISARRAAQVLGVVLVVVVIAGNGTSAFGLLRMVRLPVVFFLLGGLMFSALFPNTAFDSDGALRAMSSHKNTWGQFSLLASVVLLLTCKSQTEFRRLNLLFLAVAIGSLLFTRSATSIMAFLFVAGMFFVWHSATSQSKYNKLGLIVILSIATVLLLGAVIFTGRTPIEVVTELAYQAARRNQTLTGRTDLWQLMYPEMMKHIWTGIGYGGYWTGPFGASAAVIVYLNWGPPSQAHSGYIDVINEIGLVGLFLVILVIATHVKNIIKIYNNGHQNVAFFHFSLLAGVLFINYAESSLLRTTHFWWIMFCASVIECHFALRRLQLPNKATKSKATASANTRLIPS